MKEKKKKRRQEELPDYTVAHMDVDGMPWNSKRPWQLLPGDLQGRAGKRGVFNMRNQPKQIACRTEKHIPMQTVSMHFSQNKNRTS